MSLDGSQVAPIALNRKLHSRNLVFEACIAGAFGSLLEIALICLSPNEHRKLLKSYNDLSIEGADRIQKMLGTEKAAQYFVLKNDLTNRLKAMLAMPEKKPGEKLAPPKVIEEN